MRYFKKFTTTSYLAAVAAYVLVACSIPDPTGGQQQACAIESTICWNGQPCINGCCGGCPPDASSADANATRTCLSTLSNTGTADFSISFKINTRAVVPSTVLFQRTTCDARNDLWDVQVTSGGVLRVALIEAGGQYTDLVTTKSVSDGLTHDVTVRRVSRELQVTTDGVDSLSLPAPQNLRTLSPLGTAKGNPCEVVGLKPLMGTVSEVCLSVP